MWVEWTTLDEPTIPAAEWSVENGCLEFGIV